MDRFSDNRLKYFPFAEALRTYGKNAFRLDLTAGLTVAVFAIPQVMAYAILAGVPASTGLYAAMVMSIIAALWGSSNFVNTGPTNSAALITATAMLAVGGVSLEVLATFTIMVGLIRLGCGVLKLGKYIRYVPESAFLGFMAGAGVLIALGQLHHLFNIDGSTEKYFVLRLWSVVQRAGELNGWSLAIGLGTAIITIGLSKYGRRFPLALVAILVASGVTALLGDAAGVRLIQDISPVPRGLPSLKLPIIDIVVLIELLPSAFALAFIGLIEATSIGHRLAIKRSEDINFDQEFVGQGLSHIVGGFFQCFPGSGSFSRSTLIESSGAATRFSNVYFGLFTAGFLLLIPDLLNQIPVCALAGLLLYIAYEMVDYRAIKRVFDTSRSDTLILVTTFLITVLVKIEYGIYAGIALGAFIFFERSMNLQSYELVPKKPFGFDEKIIDPQREETRDIIALGISGDLFYGVAHQLRDLLNHVAKTRKSKIIVLRVRGAYSIDFSCWNALFDFAESFQRNGGRLYICGVRPDFEVILRDAGMEKVLPPEQVFSQEMSVFRAFHTCMELILRDLPEDFVLSPEWEDYRKIRFGLE